MLDEAIDAGAQGLRERLGHARGLDRDVVARLERRDEAQLRERRRAQGRRHSAQLLEHADDLGLQLVERAVVGAVAADHPQAHEHGGEDLGELLVQRLGEPAAVVLLRVEQAAEAGALIEQAVAVGGEAGLQREQLQRGSILGVERAAVGDLDPAEPRAAGEDRRRGVAPLHPPGHGAADAVQLDRGAGHARRAERRGRDDPRQPVIRVRLAERQSGVEQALLARVDRTHPVAEAATHRGDHHAGRRPP